MRVQQKAEATKRPRSRLTAATTMGRGRAKTPWCLHGVLLVIPHAARRTILHAARRTILHAAQRVIQHVARRVILHAEQRVILHAEQRVILPEAVRAAWAPEIAHGP